MTRRGMTLIEMIVAVTLVMAFFAVGTTAFNTYFRDVPRQVQLIESNRVLQSGLDELAADVRGGREVHIAADGAVVIKTAAGRVGYILAPDELQRFTLDADGARTDDEVWPARHAKVTWTLRKSGSGAIGLEVQSWFDRDVPGQPERKLANARILFMDLTATGKGARP